MKIDKFEILIANLPDYSNVVAEIYYDNMYWARISKEPQNHAPVIRFYSHPKNEYWELPCSESIQVIEQAKAKLLAREDSSSVQFLPNPEEINAMGQKELESILNHPNKMVYKRLHKYHGEIIEVGIPGGKGVMFTTDGEMIGFLEP